MGWVVFGESDDADRSEEAEAKDVKKNVVPRLMTEATLIGLWRRHHKLPICSACGELIQVEQRYYYERRKTKSNRYHWECAKRLNLV
jgi:hypothetical protein